MDQVCAEQSGRIAGCVLAQVEGLLRAHEITLDVASECRRSGIGTKLMSEVHREFGKRKIGTSILEVGVGNKAAQRLYRKLGYQEINTLKGYYRGCEDAYRMELIMSDP